MEVYFAHNKHNGKAYVGWTKHTAPVRFKQHCKSARRGSTDYFHKAIRRYGPEAFSVMTIWRGDSADEARQVEINVIAGMKTTNPQRGYNMTAGGGGVFGLHWKLSDETKRRQGAAAKGRPGDHRPNAKKGHPGNSFALGKNWKLSDETRRRQSIAQHRRWHVDTGKRGDKCSLCLEEGT